MPAKDIYHDCAKNALIKDQRIKIIVFDPHTEEIIKWIP